MRYVPLALVVAGAAAVGAASGWRALSVYGFFAIIAGLIYSATGVGADLLRSSSSRRFDDHRR